MKREKSIREFWELRLSKQYDLSGVGYAGLGREYNRWLYRIRKDVFVRKVTEYAGHVQDATVLDVGSGTGFYVDLWQSLGVSSIVGIDITHTAVSRLRSQHPLCEFFSVDIGGSIAQIQDRRFDYISAFDVLFHIIDEEDYCRAIQNVHFLLADGGMFFFSENFLHHEGVKTRVQVSRTLETISSFLVQAGFMIIDRSPMFSLMNSPVDSNSTLLKKWWRLLTLMVSRHEAAGRAIGGMLFPLEKFLVRHLRESPSTEIMICTKLP